MTYLGIMYTDLFNKFERLLIFFLSFYKRPFWEGSDRYIEAVCINEESLF